MSFLTRHNHPWGNTIPGLNVSMAYPTMENDDIESGTQSQQAVASYGHSAVAALFFCYCVSNLIIAILLLLKEPKEIYYYDE